MTARGARRRAVATATCPDCGRHTRKIDGQYVAHTIPGVYDRLCHQGGK